MSATANLHNFATGAVRSKDADSVRFDLITPIGLRAVGECAVEAFHDGVTDYERTGDDSLAPYNAAVALHESYRFLAGGEADLIASAAMAVLFAISEDIDEEWVPDFDAVRTLIRDGERPAAGLMLLPPGGLVAVAETYAEGAGKYGDFNWEKGMPAHDLLNHAIRHLVLWLSGDRSEPHLPHAAWGLMAAVHSVELWPHLNRGHLRGPGCVAPAEARCA